MAPPIIHFDYDFSPYGTKTKILLTAAGVPYQKCDQPLVLPRPDLEELGITYRRIPLLAVGKDIYADSSLIITAAIKELGGKIPSSPADKAYEVWGAQVFNEALGLISPDLLTPDFVKDRAAIFPFLTRPDIKTLRESAVAQFRSRLRELEEEFLGKSEGPFINGKEISIADIHAVWPFLWALTKLGVGKEPGLTKQEFPKVWRLIEALPEVKPEVLSAKDTHEKIRGAEAAKLGPSSVPKDDPYGIAQGTAVTVESFDSEPGSYPQVGKLAACDVDEFVIEIKDGVRLHFPRIGYIVRKQ